MNSAFPTAYEEAEPTREAVDALPGLTVLEFGANWCEWCQGAQPHIAQALAAEPGLRHVKVADGKGKPLGRSFRVKLWPTLVFLRLMGWPEEQAPQEGVDAVEAAAAVAGYVLSTNCRCHNCHRSAICST